MRIRIIATTLALLLTTVAQAEPAGSSPAKSFRFNDAVKTTMGPRGRAAIEGRTSFRLPQQTCYDYAFVSKRERSVENIFFGNTCSPAFKQATPNTTNSTLYGSLSASRDSDRVAAIEIDATDPKNPHPMLTTWTRDGGGGIPYYDSASRDAFLPAYPAWGPHNGLAMVTTGLDWRNPVIRRGDLNARSGETPEIMLPNNHIDTRVLGRIAWVGSRDVSAPGYHKIIASMRRGAYSVDGEARRDDSFRLYVLDSDTGDLTPLKDPSDMVDGDMAIKGQDPAVSPDGGRLAFVRNVDGLDRLWTCDLTLTPALGEGGGYNCENVTMVPSEFLEPENSQGNFDWPCWTYDGKKIFFSFDAQWSSADNLRYSKIYMVNPDGTSLQRLDNADDTYSDSYPACLPFLAKAVTSVRETVPVKQQTQYEATPVQQVYEPAPIRCDESHQCPSGMTCGTDATCHRP